MPAGQRLVLQRKVTVCLFALTGGEQQPSQKRQSSCVSLGPESDAYEYGDVTCVQYSNATTSAYRQGRCPLIWVRLGMTRVFRPYNASHSGSCGIEAAMTRVCTEWGGKGQRDKGQEQNCIT